MLSLLGPPTLMSGGTPVVPQPGSKALALLAYLVLEPHPHSRETLAALLWGESPEQEARASLRQALKQLRTGLGDLAQGDRRLIELAEPVECDAEQFRRRVGQEPGLAAATEVPRFLEGFSVRNAPRFEEWVANTRSALMLQYTTALDVLAREAIGQRKWREAIELADRWLAADPLSDEAARLAVESRYLAGNRGAALARYTEYRALLQRETGCEPSRGLLTLVRRVEADTSPSDASRPVSEEWYARTPAFDANLIGRGQEWRQLEQIWHAVARGQGRVVLLEGEAGVGKSRLAEDFVRHAVAEGAIALRGRGYDATAAIPYGPLVEVLRGGLAAPGVSGAAPEWLAEAARLLPELRQRFPHLPPAEPAAPSEAWRVFEGVGQLLAAVASEQPIIVTIDDLHWCDEDSCNLLRFLIRRLEHSPVLWLGTFTLGEMERDAPAARLSRVLRAKAHAVAISLSCLNEEEVWRLIRELGHLSSPTGGRRFARRVYDITGGNPFYILELLKTMFAQGLLATDERDGEWAAPMDALESGTVFPLSRTVQEVIAERVDRLPDELAEVLITVSVAGGHGCRPEVLSHVHGISRLHAAAVCDALVDRRLLVEDGGAYRPAHPVIGHVVRDGLTAPRRREVHRMLALSLERATPSEQSSAIAGEIARHADRGGEAGLAYRAALAASRAAQERIAFAESLSWLDLAAASASGEAERAEVNRRTADLLETAGWSEVPAGMHRGLPATREIAGEDLDLPVRK